MDANMKKLLLEINVNNRNRKETYELKSITETY